MKLYLVLIVCCAATILAAPPKVDEDDDVKAKGNISVEVKPIDLQVKITPAKIQAKFGEKKSIVTTSTTTEAATIEPTEADALDSTPKVDEASAKPTPNAKKSDKPMKDAEKLSKKDAGSVVITERPVAKKPEEKVENQRRLARGRSRFRSGNVDDAEKPDEKEKESDAKDKLEPKEEPKSTKRDNIKPENTKVKEKKNDVKKVEKLEKEKEKEKNDENEEEEAPAPAEKPKSVKVKSLKKVTQAKNDAEKSKHDKFETKQKNSSKPVEKDEDEEEEEKAKPTEENDEEEEKKEEKKKSRTASPSAEERRKGRKYHDIQIVQLESEIEEDGKYRYNYEGEDGTQVEQEGELKLMGDDQMGESVKGSYSYTDDEGRVYSVSYTADENGYRPVGDHIPTIPPAIARSLAWAATAKPWVDPWLIEQEKLKANRESRKLSNKDQKKTKRTKPVVPRDNDENEKSEIKEIDSQ